MLRRRRRHSPPTTPPAAERPRVVGKFLQVGDERLLIRGVTYGTFAPDAEGVDYPAPEVVDRDFAGMAAAGFTTLRTYTVPPRALLDLAERHGLRVLVGLPWEQHIAFLDDHGRARAIERTIREGVRSCAGHPAVLAFAIGNEIPASIVRWLGRERVEDFLERLYRAAKDEDPGALVTYVNFPTTEYLQLPFLDFCAFNVYLERQDDLAAYLARLQVLADDRPLVMAEIGLDSRRNGEDVQAEQIRTQLGTVFGAGCAGAFVFAWTDEWYRGGHDIDDWDFGLTRRDRSPKPALEVVAEAMRHVPPQPPGGWPSITAVVCSYNGAKTIDGCLRALRRVDYPDLEILVIDDGSGDGTAAVAEAHGVRVITTENRGLSAARNTGAREARGEIVAYVDDDAMPVSTWARYVGRTFATTAHAAVGGPNVPPEGGKNVARAVSSAPGGPIHVLLDDEIAEHVPGCNLAVRRDALLSIGGFDEQFRIAGDDVDLCWRIQEAGWTVGFSPAAVVLHHRRGSVPRFWRQQRGYGRAEGMLERAWPQKYNRAGHVTWHGRIYGPGPIHLLQRWRVYYGTWGSGAFQGLYRRDAPQFTALPLMPEWYLVIAILAGLTALGASWRPLLAAGPLLVLAVVLLLAQAMIGAARARLSDVPSRRRRLRIRAICTLLYLCQAAARLQGRIEFGLAPWGRRARPHARLPFPRRATLWSERWRSAEDRVQTLHDDITATGVRVRPGGDFDRWDLEVRGGGLGSARLLLAVEEHGSGKQLIRVRTRPR
ncbi:MAG: glycosyltransferase, partial [Solirubrobacteraceae bacterium]